MNKFGKNRGLIILVLIILALLVWGFIGGQQAQKIGVSCDWGLGDTFCWKWHTNALGQVQEFLDNTGNAIKDSFND